MRPLTYIFSLLFTIGIIGPLWTEDSEYVIHDLDQEMREQFPQIEGWNNIHFHSQAMTASGEVYVVVTDGGRFWYDGQEHNQPPTEVALLGRHPSGQWLNFGWPSQLDGGRFALAEILESGDGWFGLDVDLVVAEGTAVLVFYDGGANFPTVVPQVADDLVTWGFGNVLLGYPDVGMTMWGGDWSQKILAGMRWDNPLRGILVRTEDEGPELFNVNLAYDSAAFEAFSDHGFLVDSVSSQGSQTFIAGFLLAGDFFDAQGVILDGIEPEAFLPYYAVLDSDMNGAALFPELPPDITWNRNGETLTVPSGDCEVDMTFATPQGMLLLMEYEDEDLYATYFFPLIEGSLGQAQRLGDGLHIELRGITSVGRLYGRYIPHDPEDMAETGVIIDISDPQNPQLTFGQELLPQGYQEWRPFMSANEDGSIILTSWGRELALKRAEVSLRAENDTTLLQDGDAISLTLQRHDAAMLPLTVELFVGDGVEVASEDEWISQVGENLYHISFPSSWQNEDGKQRSIDLRYGSGSGLREVRVRPPAEHQAWSAHYGYRPRAGAEMVYVELQATAPTPVLRVERAFTNLSPVEVTVTFSEAVYIFDPSDAEKILVINATIDPIDVPSGLYESWSFSVTPNQEGEVSIQVLEGASSSENGTTTQASEPITFVYDHTPPQTPERPALHADSDSSDGHNITNVTENLRIIGAIEPYAHARLYLDGEPQHIDEQPTGEDGVYEFTIPGPFAHEDSVSVQVEAVDRAGNSSEKSVSLDIEIKTRTHDPEVVLTEETNSGRVNGITNVTEPVAVVTGFAHYINEVQFYIPERGESFVVPVGNGSVIADLASFHAPYEDGEYTLRVSVRDIAGNSGQAELDVIIDTVPPELSHPMEGSLVDHTEENSFVFTLHATKYIDLAYAEAFTMHDADDQPLGIEVQTEILLDGQVFVLVLATEAPSVAGPVTLAVVDRSLVVDMAGNPIESDDQFTLYYDPSPVDLTITPDDGERRNDSQMTVTFSFSEAVQGFTEEDIEVSNAELVSGTLHSEDGMIFTVDLNLGSEDGPVQVSVNAASVTALDGGNLNRQAQATVAVIDRTGPRLAANFIRITGQVPQGATALQVSDDTGLSSEEELSFDPETGEFTVVILSSRTQVRLHASSAGDSEGTTIIVHISELIEKLMEAN